MKNTSSQLQFDMEQFYYREAKLLDNRKFREWLTLLNEGLVYVMPGRHSPERDITLKEQDAFIVIDDELERPTPNTLPIREDNYFSMMFRIERCYKHNAWASNPPPRTRRLISNVMVELDDDAYRVNSHFMLFYSRHRNDNFTYTGERNDLLQKNGDDWQIVKREVILDWNVIPAPTLGLFF